MNQKIEVYSPVSGNVLQLEKIPDQVFSTGLMGPGLAVELEGLDWNVYAPVDAECSVVFPTGHAVVLKHTSGLELMIHIGIETFDKQDAFTKYVVETQKVTRGQKLIGIEKDCFSAKPLPIMINLINGNQFEFEMIDMKFVVANKTILFTINKEI
jgi:glucose-specific phosphotransferase system IIA component